MSRIQLGASPDEISSARNANHELSEDQSDHELMIMGSGSDPIGADYSGAGSSMMDPLYDIDRSLFEYVRMELKHKLKDVSSL
jgi:hypothetical protein